MPQQDRMGSPPDVVRSYVPPGGRNDQQQGVAAALDHIARVLSSIDHKLEVLIARTETDPAAVARLAASLDDKSA